MLPVELMEAAVVEAKVVEADDNDVAVVDEDGCAMRSGLDRLELLFSRSRKEDTWSMLGRTGWNKNGDERWG